MKEISMARKKSKSPPPAPPKESRLYVGAARIRKRGADVLGKKKR